MATPSPPLNPSLHIDFQIQAQIQLQCPLSTLRQAHPSLNALVLLIFSSSGPVIINTILLKLW
jgi:hypothetical protein